MGRAQKVEKIAKEDDGIFSIAVENQIGRVAHIRHPRASEILGKFPSGKFSYSEYSLVVGSGIFREGDSFTIEGVRYGSLCALSGEYIIENLCFTEHVARRKKTS